MEIARSLVVTGMPSQAWIGGSSDVSAHIDAIYIYQYQDRVGDSNERRHRDSACAYPRPGGRSDLVRSYHLPAIVLPLLEG